MSVIKIVNAEVGDLSLYELRVRPVFGMMGAGEPTERGVKRELERLQNPKNEHGKSQFFLQSGVITEFPIPLIRVDAFFFVHLEAQRRHHVKTIPNMACRQLRRCFFC